MPVPGFADLTASPRLIDLKLPARGLFSAAVAMLSLAVAFAGCASEISALQRTGAGLLIAVSMIFAGGLLSSGRGSRPWWCGTSVTAAGYVLAYFFAQATWNVSGVPTLGSPYPGWLLVIALAMVAVFQTRSHILLRWAALPFSIGTSLLILLEALGSTERWQIAGTTLELSALASVAGMLWWAALSAAYQRLELGSAATDQGAPGARLLYRVGHELCFVLAAVNALALPYYCSSAEQAPLWWSLEMPVLLAICWQSRGFVKHFLVMGVWALSAVMLLSWQLELSAIARMAIPVSGITMAMSYRYIRSAWDHTQKVIGYSAYLYASVAVAYLVPFLHLGVWDALPYWLAETGAVLALLLVLRDRILLRAGLAAGVASALLFGAYWESWSPVLVVPVVLACYGLSLAYRFVQKRGGLPSSDFVPVSALQAVTVREAYWLEVALGACGYVAMMTGSYLLLADPFNTAAWGVELLVLIGYGFATGRVGHRASGLLTLALASAKLTILDLSGTDTATHMIVSFGAVGVCAIAASIFYLVEFRSDDAEVNPPGDGSDNQG